MPPRKQIEKEAILNQAFQMTRENGFSSITARSLAASLHCSTQPIYQSFADMKALEAEVARYGMRFMLDKMQNGIQTGQPRELSFVLQYVRFAMNERHLFWLIAKNGLFRSMAGISDGSLPGVDPRLLIFVNGIVFLSAFQSLDLTWEQIQSITTNAYRAFRNMPEEEKE